MHNITFHNTITYTNIQLESQELHADNFEETSNDDIHQQKDVKGLYGKRISMYLC
jgi:hypothetical protein